MKYTRQIIGALFLITMALSVFGNLTISSIIIGDEYLSNIIAQNLTYNLATLSLLFNSFGVLGIGLFSYELLKSKNLMIARVYLTARLFEGIVLVIGIIFLMSLMFLAEKDTTLGNLPTNNPLEFAKFALRINWFSYNIAMVALGLGSIPFCILILKHKIVPKILAILGVIGYTVLALSSISGLVGIDLGLLVTIPVFFFEVILGIWLLVKGAPLKS